MNEFIQNNITALKDNSICNSHIALNTWCQYGESPLQSCATSQS